MDPRVFVLFYRVHVLLLSSSFSRCRCFDADSHWNQLPTRVNPGLKDFPSTFFRSKADSTVKKYKNEILKFIEWCNLSNVRPMSLIPSLACSAACNKL